MPLSSLRLRADCILFGLFPEEMQISDRHEKIEFRKVIVPDELEMLFDIDRRIFAPFPADLFSAEEWADFESYWMIVDGTMVGCSAFLRDTDFDIEPRPGCLHIMTTGVLPEFRRRGYGEKQKRWQIKFAKQQGFQVIVTNTRASNVAMIELNLKVGFQIRGTAPHFYFEPDEAAIVMELRLQTGTSNSTTDRSQD
jgi:ribosomal protein S18 acetylase RimI-like enzyme